MVRKSKEMMENKVKKIRSLSYIFIGANPLPLPTTQSNSTKTKKDEDKQRPNEGLLVINVQKMKKHLINCMDIINCRYDKKI